MGMDWFVVVRDMIMVVIGIAMIVSSQGRRSIWQSAFGWILIALVIADAVIIYVRGTP